MIIAKTDTAEKANTCLTFLFLAVPAVINTRRLKANTLKIIDMAVPSVIIAQAIGLFHTRLLCVVFPLLKA